MKIIRYDNPETSTTITRTANDVKYNDSEIIVEDITGLSIGDFLLLEDIGHEKAEIVKILGINGTTLTISPTTIHHAPNTILTKLDYDKFKITKSAEKTGTYTEVVIGDLDYSNPHNIIYFVDDSIDSSDLLYYKLFYYNSETDVEIEQKIFHKDNNYGFINIEKFRQETAFTESEVVDSEVERAIYTSLEWIQDNAFTWHEFDGPRDRTFSINSPLEFADWNGDNNIDKYDMIIYEFDPRTLMRRYLGNKLIKVLPNSKKIMFSENVPINVNNQLVIRIPMTSRKLETVKGTLANISRLIGTNYLLQNVNTANIRTSITSWNAGGVSVNRDIGSLQSSIEANLATARRLMSQVCKTYMRATKLRTDVSSLNYRQRYTNRFYGVSQAHDMGRRNSQW